MEPKALRTPSAQDAAALRAAVAGVPLEVAPKLTKPVQDVGGFRSTPWATATSAGPAPSPAPSLGPSLAPSVGPSPVPAPVAQPAAAPAPVSATATVSSLREDVADLRRTVAAVSESLRLLEAKLLAVQTPSGRG